MAPLTKDRNTPERDGRNYEIDVAAGQKIYAGSIVVRNATGYAEKGATATGKKYWGRAEESVDNTGGANGDKKVKVRRGCFRWTNDGSISAANLGNTAYIVDDQTVAAADGGGTRSAAGIIRDIDAAGVWVEA